LSLFCILVLVLLYNAGPALQWSTVIRLCHLLGLVWLLRSLTIIVTSPPDPALSCRGFRPDQRWWDNSIFFWHKTCGDLMFSGHTSFMLTVTILFTHYAPVFAYRVVAVALIWLAAIAGLLSLVATKYHYSSDVIVSAYITSSMYYLYDFCVKHHASSLTNWFDLERACHGSLPSVDSADIQHNDGRLQAHRLLPSDALSHAKLDSNDDW